MAKLEGKVAVITGGSSGIGLATAKLFQEEGARVAIVGRDREVLDRAVTELGPQALAVAADVAKLDDLDRLYRAVGDRFGRIDILFANAGIARLGSVETVDEAVYDQIMDINVKGAFFTVQKALPLMKQGGSIILTTSNAAAMGLPNFSAYSATKAALCSFARTMTADLVDRGIRVNALSPGGVETPIYGKLGVPEETVQGMAQYVLARVPMKRFGQPDEIARAALYLASEDSTYVTGAELSVDGGLGQV